MHLRTLLFLLVALCSVASVSAQKLVSATLLGSKTATQLIAQFNVPFIQYGVKYYKVLYTTPDLKGVLDTASGLIVVPNNPARVYPRLVYQHGTSGTKQDVPSLNVLQDGEGTIGWLFAGMGYVTLMPDYLGLGESRGFHPYVHAESETSVALDMLRAAVEFGAQQQVQTNSQVFVTGYSQGGHAAMAVHRAIEKDPAQEFAVTAAAPLSGPYSIGEVMRNLILTDQVYLYPAYIPNTALSYQTAYGNIFTDLTDLFKPAYATLIDKFYKNQIGLSQLNQQLITLITANEGSCRPFKMLQESAVEAIKTNPDHPVNVALRANNTYNNWLPKAPMRLFYCMADDQVPFQNAVLARDTFKAIGAPNFDAIDVNSTANHNGCVVPALTSTVFFFAGFQQIGTVGTASPWRVGSLDISPNPAHDLVQLRNIEARGELRIFGEEGRVLYRAMLEPGDHSIDLSGLASGVYFAQFVAGKKVWTEKILLQK